MSQELRKQYQRVAIDHAERLGKLIMINYPGVAAMYRKGQGYLSIAKQIPHVRIIAEKYPKVAKNAIGYAVKNLSNGEDQTEATASIRRKTLASNVSRIDTHQRSINTAETKARRGNVISVKSLDAIIEGQGRKGWVKEEAKMIFKLMILPEYCHTKGPAKIGSPNYEKIAKFLNQQYHQGAPVRYRNSVANKVREELKKESNV